MDLPEPMRRFLQGDLESWLRVEEYREGNSLVVKAEVPGIDPETDVDVSVTDNVLTIDARREEKAEHKDKDGYRSEFRYGTFSRSVSLPPGARQEDVQASYTDGVLEVRIPVPEQPEPSSRRIPVSRD
jgi:HSP20 family protein